jgi:hypothetical protein
MKADRGPARVFSPRAPAGFSEDRPAHPVAGAAIALAVFVALSWICAALS